MAENEQLQKKMTRSIDSNNGIFTAVGDNKKMDSAHLVYDLVMVAEEDPLSMTQARAYRREVLFTKTFSLLLSEDGINPKDFDEDLELEYGCKLDDVFKVTANGSGSIRFVIPSNLMEARAMLQAKYQSILKGSQSKHSTSEELPSQSLAANSKKNLTQADPANELQKKRTPAIKRTYGRSAPQHSTPAEDSSSPPSKRAGKETSGTETVSFETIADVDSYFYATMKGSQSYSEQKGDFTFECCVCNEVLDDNIKAVMHMHSHLGDSTGSMATRCESCYRWFATEDEMEKHEEEHAKAGKIVCRICDSEFTTISDLVSHMQTTHVRREMPYACRLCGFRSSLYVDTVDHFTSVHANTSFAQCAFCLQIYQLKPPTTGGACRTSNFYDHLTRHHRDKESQANCFRCRLSFLGFGDLPRHEKLEHQPGNSVHCSNRFPACGEKVVRNEDRDASRVTINASSSALCRECSQPMSRKGHFTQLSSCTAAASSCSYTSSCSFAMAKHLSNHRRQPRTTRSTAPPLSKTLYCECGFSANIGAAMAAHLVACTSGSKSCSTVPPVSFKSN